MVFAARRGENAAMFYVASITDLKTRFIFFKFLRFVDFFLLPFLAFALLGVAIIDLSR